MVRNTIRFVQREIYTRNQSTKRLVLTNLLNCGLYRNTMAAALGITPVCRLVERFLSEIQAFSGIIT